MGRWIKANGTVEEVKPKSGGKFSLEELQGFVGGYIELVRLPNKQTMFVNEEGKLNGLAVNSEATEISGLFPYDVICGDAIVLEPSEEDNE